KNIADICFANDGSQAFDRGGYVSQKDLQAPCCPWRLERAVVSTPALARPARGKDPCRSGLYTPFHYPGIALRRSVESIQHDPAISSGLASGLAARTAI